VGKRSASAVRKSLAGKAGLWPSEGFKLESEFLAACDFLKVDIRGTGPECERVDYYGARLRLRNIVRIKKPPCDRVTKKSVRPFAIATNRPFLPRRKRRGSLGNTTLRLRDLTA
jgi:hypothetical protein